MFRIQVKSGKIVDEIASQDGFYLMQIFPEKCKTLVEWRKQYFMVIEEFAAHTGMTKYEIHEEFKKENALESITKIELDKWPEIIESIKFWCLMKL